MGHPLRTWPGRYERLRPSTRNANISEDNGNANQSHNRPNDCDTTADSGCTLRDTGHVPISARNWRHSQGVASIAGKVNSRYQYPIAAFPIIALSLRAGRLFGLGLPSHNAIESRFGRENLTSVRPDFRDGQQARDHASHRFPETGQYATIAECVVPAYVRQFCVYVCVCVLICASVSSCTQLRDSTTVMFSSFGILRKSAGRTT